MFFFFIKAVLSGVIVATVATIAKRAITILLYAAMSWVAPRVGIVL